MTTHYQHSVSIWNTKTGLYHRGVFRTHNQAQYFMDNNEGTEKHLTSEFSDWPYGVYTAPFDVDGYNARLSEEFAEEMI